MPKRPAVLAVPAALVLAALLACACAPGVAPAPQPAQIGQAGQPGQAQAPQALRDRRLALAAFHLRDERGGGPAEALKALDGPEPAPAQAGPNELAQTAANELALRAVALNQLGRYAEAVAALDRLMLARRDLPPEALADAFVERGLALAALGRQPRAAEDFAAALAVAPRHIPALLARADQLFALGQPAEAEAGYSRVIEIAPKNILARRAGPLRRGHRRLHPGPGPGPGFACGAGEPWGRALSGRGPGRHVRGL
jgi:tetratricopeptide (TPR) repeat protein